MKLFKFLLLFLYTNCLFSQIYKRVGKIDVKVTTYSYKIDSLDESGIKRKIAFDEFYFDNDGRKLESIKYDLKSTSDIKTISEIEQFIYNGQKLLRSDKWILNSKINKTDFYFTEYDYDINDSLINESFYQTNRDTLWHSRKYTRSKNITEIRENIPGNLQISYYNDEGKIIKIKRLTNSWIGNKTYNFEYYNNCRKQIEEKETNPKIIICYDLNGKVSTKEVTSENYKTLYQYLYHKNGLLDEIIVTAIHKNLKEKMRNVSFQYFKKEKLRVKSVLKINQSLIENIY